MNSLTHYPGTAAAPFISFMDGPRLDDAAAKAARFAIIGAPFGVPYGMRQIHYGASNAPAALRQKSARFGAFVDRFDFDLGSPLQDLGGLQLVDCGDVRADPRDLAGNAQRVVAAIRAQLDLGRMPIVLGGDDSTSALAIKAYEGHGPIEVLQIDAHIDFRDEVDGIRDGYSSPMRRASEMPWVKKIVHLGARGVGSARKQDVADTLAAGNAIVTSREFRSGGIDTVLGQLTPGARYHLVIDVDGFDPTVMPGTSAPMPGGLAYEPVIELIQALVKQGRVMSLNFAEHYPDLDINGITSLGIVRIIANVMGAMQAKALT